MVVLSRGCVGRFTSGASSPEVVWSRWRAVRQWRRGLAAIRFGASLDPVQEIAQETPSPLTVSGGRSPVLVKGGVLFPKRDPRKTSEWGVVHPDAAGMDVHSEFHFVAVPSGREAEPVRRFGAFTEDLERLADGLQTCGVRSVAMESTGVYWIPLFELLERRGFQPG